LRFLNPEQRLVQALPLVNGRQMLFLISELDTAKGGSPIDVRYLQALRERLRAEGNEFLVILVPDKYAVYQPLISGRPPGDSAVYLNHTEYALRRAGVPVVNLTGPLRQQASELIERGEYNYWVDDSHWNTNGIRRAANVIAPEAQRLLGGSNDAH
jgi:hypothetical protein